MNFLAHIYLSGHDPDLIIGNFIADHVKGKQFFNFSPEIRKGILLHREIDSFTDSHPVVSDTKSRIRPVFKKYAPVVADVYYDHFLAASWSQLSDTSLEVFAADFYKMISKSADILPDRTRNMLTYMIRQDWLTSYATVDGIGNILKAMAARASFTSNMEKGGDELLRSYNFIKKDFEDFFPELQNHATQKISILSEMEI
jgi:acyl carrier protein phosphodiesterase